jgi:hypothetical protein
MKLRRVVLAIFIFSLVIASSASAICFEGVGWYDTQGWWHCAYSSGGNCLFCADEIVVKG